MANNFLYCLIHLSDFSTVFAKVRKNHLSSHNPGNTIFRPVSDQLAKVFDFEIIYLMLRKFFRSILVMIIYYVGRHGKLDIGWDMILSLTWMT